MQPNVKHLCLFHKLAFVCWTFLSCDSCECNDALLVWHGRLRNSKESLQRAIQNVLHYAQSKICSTMRNLKCSLQCTIQNVLYNKQTKIVSKSHTIEDSLCNTLQKVKNAHHQTHNTFVACYKKVWLCRGNTMEHKTQNKLEKKRLIATICFCPTCPLVPYFVVATVQRV